MIVVGIKREPGEVFRVTLWSHEGYPLATYTSKRVFLDDKPVEGDELFVSAVLVKYLKDKNEVYVYTKPQ